MQKFRGRRKTAQFSRAIDSNDLTRFAASESVFLSFFFQPNENYIRRLCAWPTHLSGAVCNFCARRPLFALGDIDNIPVNFNICYDPPGNRGCIQQLALIHWQRYLINRDIHLMFINNTRSSSNYLRKRRIKCLRILAVCTPYMPINTKKNRKKNEKRRCNCNWGP